MKINLAGEKINKLNVIGIYEGAEFDYRRGNQWICICDCGKEKIVEQERLINKKVQSCGCIQKGRANTWLRKEYGESIKNRIIAQYKSNAKQKEKEFNLSEEECEIIFQSDCYYCNREPFKELKIKGRYGSYTYNGIDRLDSSLGYIKENSVSCCWECNYMKNNINHDEFLLIIEKIYKNLEINNESRLF